MNSYKLCYYLYFSIQYLIKYFPNAVYPFIICEARLLSPRSRSVKNSITNIYLLLLSPFWLYFNGCAKLHESYRGEKAPWETLCMRMNWKNKL